MKDKKDNFSVQSDSYARYRPEYPQELFEWIYRHCGAFDTAWDCATGTGQAAHPLSAKFKTVYATDISVNQLAKAKPAANIEYSQQPAEQTAFPDNSFDLITVAQALHWLDHRSFFEEVQRVAKHHCLFTAWGYNLVRVNEQVDAVIDHFYNEVIGAYWDDERRHVETGYTHINMPFDIIDPPTLYIDDKWTVEHMLGYLDSWSAVQHYIKDKSVDPASIISQDLKSAWENNIKLHVRFPLFVKAGIIKK